jgi:hypothetical protein
MSNWNTDYKRVCFGAAASFITPAKEESRRGDEAQSCRMDGVHCDVKEGRAVWDWTELVRKSDLILQYRT